MSALLDLIAEVLCDCGCGFLVGVLGGWLELVEVDLVAVVEGGVAREGDDRADAVLELGGGAAGVASAGGGVVEEYGGGLDAVAVSEADEVAHHDLGGVGAVGACRHRDEELVSGGEC